MVRTASTIVLAVLAACGSGSSSKPGPSPAPDPTPSPAPPAIDLSALTAKAGLAPDAACVVVRDPDGTVRASDRDRCALRLRPASTFKLPNALVGADLGLITGPDTILRYDARRYPKKPGWRDGWAQDQPLTVALEISALPLFQSLATEIGEPRMQAHLDALGYGNRSITGGIDRFWLAGGLAISAFEQVDFLARLVAGTLPVSARAQEIVRAATPVERAADATLHWKTGTGDLDDGHRGGWLVGWIDRPAGTTVYACWILDPAEDLQVLLAHRMDVCRGALAAQGLFPAPP